MGEGKRRALARVTQDPGGNNGHLLQQLRVRIVRNIKVQRHEALVMMLLGDAGPEVGVGMTPDEARKVAEVLTHHADALDGGGRRIILPGG